MNHLDEGTIHAWLDGGGALDATQSREIETHIAQCAACSAAVAEARGLVAGASRILNALDDVPGGVLPKRAPAPAIKPARRQWRAARWVTGIAAAGLLFAIGVTQLDRAGRGRGSTTAEVKTVAAVDSTAAKAFQPMAAAPVAQVETPAQPRSQAPVRAPAAAPQIVAAEESRRRDLSRAEVGGGGERARSLRQDAVADAARPSEPSPKVAVKSEAGSGAAGRGVLAARDTARLRRFDAVVVTNAPESPSAPMVMQKSANETAEKDRLAGAGVGCYRIEPEDKNARVRSLTPMAGALGRATAGVGGGAARTPDRPATQYVTATPPALVRLDTMKHRLGFVVRAATSDSSIGSWLRIAGDSARVDLLAAGLFRFSLKDRLACPER